MCVFSPAQLKHTADKIPLLAPLFPLFLLRGNEDTPYDICHNMAYPITKAKAEKMVLSANGAQVTGDPHLRQRPSELERDDLEESGFLCRFRAGSACTRAL